MYSLPIPARDHMADYAACIGHRKALAVKTLLTGATGQVKTAYDAYLACQGNASIVLPISASDALKTAWRGNYRLLSDAGPMAGMRGELMAVAKHGLCPLCGRGSVATLDHHLPKTHFPEFSAFGANLIPACDGCNRSKGTKCGLTVHTQFLHVYYDVLPDEEILQAQVSVVGGILVDFAIVPTPSLDKPTLHRLHYHFRTLKLRAHFRREANLELSDRKDALRETYGAGDALGVREYLRREARSVRTSRGLNNWKTALLLALSRHDAFCAGGLLKL